MIIPIEALSDQALSGLIEEYCLRDWGLNERESPLAERAQQVRSALNSGELVVVFSQAHESAHIVARSAFEE